MAASFRLLEQVADTTEGPFFVLAGQSAEAEPVAVFRLTEQHADIAGGSLAAFRLTSQSAQATPSPSAPSPSGVYCLVDGTWRPAPLFFLSGGNWS